VARRDPKLIALKAVPLFAGLRRPGLAAVARIADELDLPAGKVLIAEGSLGRQFFVLLEGAAVVRRRGRKLATLGDGDFFGEIALLARRRTTATVTTTAPSRVLVITRAGFGQLLRTSPEIQWAVIQALARRMPADEVLAPAAP
jgi:voltage-gated potassium channel